MELSVKRRRAMPRPVSAQTRNENVMKLTAARQLHNTSDAVEKLRLLCLQRGSAGILGLGKVFRRMDDNGSGDLSRDEFIKGLDDSGMAPFLEAEDYEKLFEMFDADNSGAIKFDEFIRTIRPKMSPSREALVAKAFQKLDRSGDGQVTFEDLKSVYNVRNHPEYLNGQKTERELLNKFLATFEQGGVVDGVVTKDEFFDYYSGVSASIDEDAYFDLMMRTCWKL
ncbi:calcyphosin-like protein isoform X1 [Dermacentor albipictus]|uniref:calcyphosin-like protein isoform X1 n=2 Tax=Dermacentor TaxID=34619 RepID=UPI0031FC023D